MKINIYFFGFTVYNCCNSHSILSAAALGQSEWIPNVRQALYSRETEVEFSLSIWLSQWKLCLFILLLYDMYDSPESAATAILIRPLKPFCPALCQEWFEAWQFWEVGTDVVLSIIRSVKCSCQRFCSPSAHVQAHHPHLHLCTIVKMFRW